MKNAILVSRLITFALLPLLVPTVRMGDIESHMIKGKLGGNWTVHFLERIIRNTLAKN